MSVGATASSRTSNPPTSSSATRPNSREGTNTGTSTGASSSSNDSGSADSTSRTGRSTSTTTDGSDRSSQTSSGTEDRSEISSEASRTDQSPKSEKETRNDHLRALEDNFSIFDNPEGGNNDGISGLGDFEKVAGGEYDREKAEASLRSQGLSDRQIKERLDSVEDTAQYFLDDTDSREFVDSANDGEGRSDGKIGRQDLDKALLEVDEQERQQQIEDAESGTSQLTEEQREEALQTVARWQEPEALNQELKERPLSDFSQAELTALAAVSEDNPELQEQIEDAVNSSVVSSESLEDLPEGEAYNYLLNKYVTGQEVPEDRQNRDDDPTVRSQKHLEGLTGDAIKGSLDKHLEGRSGDADLESAQQRVSSDLETLALSNPALAKTIESQAESVFGEYSDKFTEIGRADDNWLQKANHAITGGLRSGVGWVTDGFRDVVDVASTGLSAPTRLLGEVGEFAIEGAGKLAGAGLDAVGADGVADNVRNASEVAGDAVDSASDFLADQNKNFADGLGESVAGTVDGLAYAITDPVGTAKGLYELAKDPGQLVDIYKDKVEEQGVAGVAGELVGDVALGVLTGGSGAAAKGVSIAGKVAKLAPDGKVMTFVNSSVEAGGFTRKLAGDFKNSNGGSIPPLDGPDGVPGAADAGRNSQAFDLPDSSQSFPALPGAPVGHYTPPGTAPTSAPRYTAQSPADTQATAPINLNGSASASPRYTAQSPADTQATTPISLNGSAAAGPRHTAQSPADTNSTAPINRSEATNGRPGEASSEWKVSQFGDGREIRTRRFVDAQGQVWNQAELGGRLFSDRVDNRPRNSRGAVREGSGQSGGPAARQQVLQGPENTPWQAMDSADGTSGVTRRYIDHTGTRWQESMVGENRWRQNLDAADRARAAGPNTEISVPGVNGTLRIPIDGASPKELKKLTKQIEALPPRIRENIPRITVADDIGQILDAHGNFKSVVAGFGSPKEIILDRVAVRGKKEIRETLYHEIGHVQDFRGAPGRPRLSDDRPWGDGRGVSDYGNSNKLEDYAEAHKEVAQNLSKKLAFRRLSKMSPEQIYRHHGVTAGYRYVHILHNYGYLR